MSNEIQKCSISWQTTQDVHLTLCCFVDLVQYTNSEEFKEKYISATYTNPKRINQEIHVVESWFSFQIGCCGDLQCCSIVKTAICKTGKMWHYQIQLWQCNKSRWRDDQQMKSAMAKSLTSLSIYRIVVRRSGLLTFSKS
jgi:hypothetical protein